MCIRDRVYRPRFGHQKCTEKVVRESLSVKQEPLKYVKPAPCNCGAVAAGYLQRSVDRLMKTHRRLRVILLPCLHFNDCVSVLTNCHTRNLGVIVTLGNLSSLYNTTKKINHWASNWAINGSEFKLIFLFNQ